MSHFTKNSKANIVDRVAFEEACKELGLTNVIHDTTIQSFYGEAAQKVDVLASYGQRCQVGLQKNAKGQYDMIADWYCVNRETPSALKAQMGNGRSAENAILQFTTKHTLARKYRSQGYNCQFTNSQDGAIKMVMTKF